MNVTVTACDLEPVTSCSLYSQAADEARNRVNLVGTPRERMSLLCDWVALEMDAVDLHDHDTIAALKRMIVKVDKSLKASDIPTPK